MNARTCALLLAAGVLAGGCAALDADTCRNADWYRMGFRDAVYGIQSQSEVYRYRCEQYGTKVDEARYAQGWREGKYEYDRRTARGGGGM